MWEKLQNGRIKGILQIQLVVMVIMLGLAIYREQRDLEYSVLIQFAFIINLALSSIESFLLKKKSLALILALVVGVMCYLTFQLL